MSFDGLVLTVLAVLAGIFVGLARGGRFRNIIGIPVRAKGLLVIGVVVPSLADQFTREVAVPLVVGGLGALLAFAIVNVRIVGMSVMAVGILANLLATFLNGGMPVNRNALVDAGLASRAEVDRVELRGARRLVEATHRVRFLGDIIPLAETGQVLAFGDLVILVGLADIAANLTLHKRKRTHAAVGDDTTDVAGASPVNDAVAVIDLVRIHAPRGPHQPRPRPPGVSETQPAVAHPGLVVTSPDVDWWPAAHADNPVVDPPRVPEFVEEPIDKTPVEAEPVEAGAELDQATPRRLSRALDLDRRWAPEPATEVDLSDGPWSTEPRWADDAEPEPSASDLEQPGAESAAVVDLREEPVHIPFTPPTAPAAEHVVDDDDVFRLLFADLSKSRRHRRRGQRIIPDFEPVHVDDITLQGR